LRFANHTIKLIINPRAINDIFRISGYRSSISFIKVNQCGGICYKAIEFVFQWWENVQRIISNQIKTECTIACTVKSQLCKQNKPQKCQGKLINSYNDHVRDEEDSGIKGTRVRSTVCTWNVHRMVSSEGLLKM
jgi:hypothetical protein